MTARITMATTAASPWARDRFKRVPRTGSSTHRLPHADAVRCTRNDGSE
jgi:hypothetical protein